MTSSSSGQGGAGTAPAVSDAAVEAVAANATRHLLEADQHYKAKRFPSAIASAVLSIEEAGKLNLLTVRGSIPKRKRHASHAAPFIALLKAVGSWRWFAEWTNALQGEAGVAAVDFTEQQQADVAQHSELKQFVRRLQAGELTDSAERLRAWTEAVIAKEKRDGTYKAWERLFSSGLQEVRLNATYVKISDSGTLEKDPRANEDEFAKFLCAGAVGFVFLTLMLAALGGRKCIVLRELLREIPDDLTGWPAMRDALLGPFTTLESIPSLQSLAAYADEAIRAT